jgi:hypothetical protein
VKANPREAAAGPPLICSSRVGLVPDRGYANFRERTFYELR